MWDLPGPGLQPVSPALAGGFLTTAPPGKPQTHFSFVITQGSPGCALPRGTWQKGFLLAGAVTTGGTPLFLIHPKAPSELAAAP